MMIDISNATQQPLFDDIAVATEDDRPVIYGSYSYSANAGLPSRVEEMECGLFSDDNTIKEKIRKAYIQLDLDRVLRLTRLLLSTTHSMDNLLNRIRDTEMLRRRLEKIPEGDRSSLKALAREFQTCDTSLPRLAIIQGLSAAINQK
jgi:hypothetical protein